ncbi:MAG: Ig-like domain-containing protein, partial [Sulfuricaulis sp.]|nr:Ig-like domain-containing protein [Sulfuricaulis sp.]
MNKMNKFESYSRFLTWFIALLLSALAAGCGGGGGGGRDPILGIGDIAALAPTVTAVAPLRNATGVPTNTKIITAAFSNAMDPATLTTASFTLACPAGTPVTGAVTYVAADNAATLTLPAAPNLPPSTVCTATVTTGAKDTIGIPLAGNFAHHVETGRDQAQAGKLNTAVPERRERHVGPDRLDPRKRFRPERGILFDHYV